MKGTWFNEQWNFEKRKQFLDLRKKIIKTEKERLKGVKTLTVDEVKKYRKY